MIRFLIIAFALLVLYAVLDAAWSDMQRIRDLEARVAYLEGAARPLVEGSDGTTVNFFIDGEKE